MNVDLLSALNNSLPSLSPLGVGTLLATQQPTTIQTNKDEEESSTEKKPNPEDKILGEIYKMEELGINTMLPLADPYIIRILQEYRREGGKMQFIFQPFMPS